MASTDTTRPARPAERRRIVRWAIGRLERLFGRQIWRRWGDGLEELVGTILSQNTSNVNSGRAYDSLVEKLPTWDAVADAPVRAIERAIRSAGLSRQKSRRIKVILRQIRTQRGELSLEFLADMPVGQARDYLTAFPGVGPKTAACILLFSFHKRILPVDTHVHRVAIRLGLIGKKTSADAAHAALEEIVPPRQFYNFHILLVKHGRQVCKAQRPRCHDCPLMPRCPAGKTFIRKGAAAGSVRD